ncbi:hypothetical protein BRPE67_BCDS10900 [Caballeronia cordobensis]|nr:hypothetical protein BRPE67_BCDS10900 [Burkholderia sp. RPE67]
MLEARRQVQSADAAATAIVEAQFGWYDATDREANSLYTKVFDNLIDDRIKDLSMPELIALLDD